MLRVLVSRRRWLKDQSDNKLKLVRRTYIVAYLATLSSAAAGEAALLCWILTNQFLTMTPSKNPKVAVYIPLTRGSTVEYKVKIELYRDLWCTRVQMTYYTPAPPLMCSRAWNCDDIDIFSGKGKLQLQIKETLFLLIQRITMPQIAMPRITMPRIINLLDPSHVDK